MADTEHRDIYIAAAVGGTGLVLVLLYVFGNNQPAATATNADGTPLPSIGATPPPAQSAYNYNIAPFTPAPGIPYPRSSLPPNTIAQSGGGCCDKCGPSTGSQYFNSTVAQFQTLIGYGADAGG